MRANPANTSFTSTVAGTTTIPLGLASLRISKIGNSVTLGGSSPITFQNEYDEHGFLKRSVLSTNVGGEPQVVNLNYQYIKL